MHPAQQINYLSFQIVAGNYDQAIESLTRTLKILQYAITGDAKISMMCPEEPDDHFEAEACSARTTSASASASATPQQQQQQQQQQQPQRNTTSGGLRYDFFSCCSGDTASSALWLESIDNNGAVPAVPVPNRTLATGATESSSNSSSPWRCNRGGPVRPCHEHEHQHEHETPTTHSSACHYHRCHNNYNNNNYYNNNNNNKGTAGHGIETDDSSPLSPAISIFADPIVVRGGDRPPVHLDVETCEDLSYAVIYNLAVAHHLKSEAIAAAAANTANTTSDQQQQKQLTSLSCLRTVYLHKALSLYEYSHQLVRKQHLTLVPALHSMALANNVGHIHQVLRHHDKTDLCMQHILSIVVYLIDRGEFVLSNNRNSNDSSLGGSNNATSIERFFYTALRIMARDGPAASA